MTQQNEIDPEGSNQMSRRDELEAARDFLKRAKRAENAARNVDREYYAYYRRKAFGNREIAREIIDEYS